MSQLPVNRNFPLNISPLSLSATLIPHIYFKLSTSTCSPLNTFPPPLLPVILLFETLSPNQCGGSQNSQPYQGEVFALGGTYHRAFSLLAENTTSQNSNIAFYFNT